MLTVDFGLSVNVSTAWEMNLFWISRGMYICIIKNRKFELILRYIKEKKYKTKTQCISSQKHLTLNLLKHFCSNHSLMLGRLSVSPVCSLSEVRVLVLFSAVSLAMCSHTVSLSDCLSWPPSAHPPRVAPHTWAQTLPSTPTLPSICGRKALTLRSKWLS